MFDEKQVERMNKKLYGYKFGGIIDVPGLDKSEFILSRRGLAVKFPSFMYLTDFKGEGYRGQGNGCAKSFTILITPEIARSIDIMAEEEKCDKVPYKVVEYEYEEGRYAEIYVLTCEIKYYLKDTRTNQLVLKDEKRWPKVQMRTDKIHKWEDLSPSTIELLDCGKGTVISSAFCDLYFKKYSTGDKLHCLCNEFKAHISELPAKDEGMWDDEEYEDETTAYQAPNYTEEDLPFGNN